MKKCEFCGKETEELNVIDGHYCCNDCRENKELFIICPQYNDYVFKELAVEVITNSGVQLWCPEAAESHAWKCNDCGKRFENAVRQNPTSSGYVCDTCAANYVRCRHCGQLFRNSDDFTQGVCRHCFEQAERERLRHVVHSYGYKPLLNFYGSDDTIFMGFELESGKAEYKSEMREGLEELLDDDKEEHFVFKHDSSIPGNGAEMVTMPMTLAYHKSYKWKEIMEHLGNKAGLKPCRGCGLHVHVNRTATNNWNWHKIDAFVNNYRSFCEMISGRSESSYSRYRDVTCTKKQEITSCDHYSWSTGHGTAVNTGNRDTVEFRIFQATFDVTELYARLEFLHALIKHSNSLKASDITAKKQSEVDKFVAFVMKHEKQYENLVKYLSKHYSK